MSAATLKGHELAGEYAALDELLAETEGEITSEIELLLAGLEESANDKIHRTALVVLRYLGESKVIKEEEARLAARRKAKERAAEGLKRYLERVMTAIGKEKVAGELCTVALQKNSPSVKVDVPLEDVYEILDDRDRAAGIIERVESVEYKLNREYFLALYRQDPALVAPYAASIGVRVEQSISLRIR